ncbi:MAG: methylenetetrahydrofolate reductase [NAD(P)H] [Gemmataceae bacterium]
MHIRELYERSEPTFSFEFFPPKTPEDETKLFEETIPHLQGLGPSFFSVTYGAGGSTREATLRIVSAIRNTFNIESMAHLTCVGSTKDQINDVLDEAKSLGIENVLALRGDPPKGEAEFVPTEGGFTYSLDLIKFIKARGDFGIGAACYPEGHQECPEGKIKDWDNAVAKVEAGADFLITQLFYDWNDFVEMDDYLRNKKGLTVPIIPGVLPFLKTSQIKRFTSLCGASIPKPMLKKLEEYGDDDEAVRQYGVEICTDICQKALEYGVPGIHFYCLNRVPSAEEIVSNLKSVA